MRTVRYIFTLLLAIVIILSIGCDVHEFPKVKDSVRVYLRLSYDTSLPKWEHEYNPYPEEESAATSSQSDEPSTAGVKSTQSEEPSTKSVRSKGHMRYRVKAYPIINGSTSDNLYKEFEFNLNISGGKYDITLPVQLPSGEYKIIVWSDLVEEKGDTPIYEIEEFKEITFIGEHKGSTDYKDAFRGTTGCAVRRTIHETTPDTLDVVMKRPLAKFEFVTTDLDEFIEKEIKRYTASTKTMVEDIDFNNYMVVFHYAGFMPCSFNLFSDKPEDSSTGVLFRSSLSQLNDTEASLGFDYVFVTGKESGVMVQVAIFDKDGTQLSMSGAIEVPIKESWHTVMRGRFLMTSASGGLGIDPSFDDEYNIFINY